LPVEIWVGINYRVVDGGWTAVFIALRRVFYERKMFLNDFFMDLKGEGGRLNPFKFIDFPENE